MDWDERNIKNRNRNYIWIGMNGISRINIMFINHGDPRRYILKDLYISDRNTIFDIIYSTLSSHIDLSRNIKTEYSIFNLNIGLFKRMRIDVQLDQI